MQGALFKINLLHICKKNKIKSGKLANLSKKIVKKIVKNSSKTLLKYL